MDFFTFNSNSMGFLGCTTFIHITIQLTEKIPRNNSFNMSTTKIFEFILFFLRHFIYRGENVEKKNVRPPIEAFSASNILLVLKEVLILKQFSRREKDWQHQ